MRQYFTPVSAVGFLPDLDLHQAVVRRVPVRADDPAAVEVRGVVEMVASARQEDRELRRIGSVRIAQLTRQRAARLDEDILAVLGVANARVEALVLLLVDEGVILGVRAQDMLADLVAQQRLGMLLDVKHRAAVRRPGDRRVDIGDPVRQCRSGRDILEANRPLAAADVVLSVGEDAIVRADLQRANLEEFESRGEHVDIEHHLLGRVERPGLARVDRVFLAGLEPAEVPEPAFAVGHAGVVLLDARDDLVVDLVLERRHMREHRLPVGIFRLEVPDDVGVLARIVTQPVILVDAIAKGRTDHVAADGRNRRSGFHGGSRCRAGRRSGNCRTTGAEQHACAKRYPCKELRPHWGNSRGRVVSAED